MKPRQPAVTPGDGAVPIPAGAIPGDRGEKQVFCAPLRFPEGFFIFSKEGKTLVKATNLGFPRIGLQRELKRAVEAYWDGRISRADLEEAGRELRRRHWLVQREAGLDIIPSNDFSFYDQVLDMACTVGAVPDRYRLGIGGADSGGGTGGDAGGSIDLDVMFAMARGTAGNGLAPLEMTKWFDTNYHYIVPELAPGQRFSLAGDKPVAEFREAQDLGITTRPVLVGPLTFLWLSKPAQAGQAGGGHEGAPLALLDNLLPVYGELLQRLAGAGAQWVQLDEPILALDLPQEVRSAFPRAYEALAGAAPGLKLFLATYFGDLGENLDLALDLPVDALHLDLVRGPGQLDRALARGVPSQLSLSLGVVDGRNVWRTDLDRALTQVERAAAALGPDRVLVAPSCSLLHVPMDLALEEDLDPEIRSWLAFAQQKLEEVVIIARGAGQGRAAVAAQLAENAAALEAFRTSPRRHLPQVQERVKALRPEDSRRTVPLAERRRAQREHLGLPRHLPTTTIGSFPQTPELRALRAQWRRGELSTAEYEAALRVEIDRVIQLQEMLGLDVLVHGEPERNDMVEYFAEQLQGFAFTGHGWVQSYGSRCVKPPILYGDVARPKAMTVDWITHAQSRTAKPVKGMLTGPVTIMQWSFVRDDVPRAEVCRQLALAIRDEIADLEAAGIRVIQLDEPAFREAMPLRRDQWDEYVDWATECFRLATAVVAPETQIQTHMCYSEFNNIMDAIIALDADVLLIEASRSKMELLNAFQGFKYPADVGPGVYDIHSPRVPPVEEMAELLRKAVAVLPVGQIWVNPDCGLKTRRYEEVQPALRRMVVAAQMVRAELAGEKAGD